MLRSFYGSYVKYVNIKSLKLIFNKIMRMSFVVMDYKVRR
jgi:hypothetical protein